MANLVCSKCRRTLIEGSFYKKRDGTYCDLCKKCLTMHINNFEPDTFLWILELMDVPYVPTEWNIIRDQEFAKNSSKAMGSSVFGKYMGKMRLKQWKDKYWLDSEKIQKEIEEKTKARELELQKSKNELKEQYESGEISEAEFKTLSTPDDMYKQYLEEREEIAKKLEEESRIREEQEELRKQQQKEIIKQRLQEGQLYGVNDENNLNVNPYQEKNYIDPLELPDPSAELSHEDKIYLAVKWGTLYKPNEWIQLEQLYNDYAKSFDITNPSRADTLKFVCKTSLKMNQALDDDDVETYKKLASTYDQQLKSGKFAEVSNKEEKKSDFDCLGKIVDFCEKEGGYIPRYIVNTPKDDVDITIQDLKTYNRTLIMQDPTIAQLIEAFLKKKEILMEQKENERKNKLTGNDQISDKDYIEYMDSLENQEQQQNGTELIHYEDEEEE